MKYLAAFLVALTFTACTENSRARIWGGKSTVEIPADRKFVNATWKDVDLWVLTRKRTELDTIRDEYTFHEKSRYGMLEGVVIFKEL
jgi:hypothetical protein